MKVGSPFNHGDGGPGERNFSIEHKAGRERDDEQRPVLMSSTGPVPGVVGFALDPRAKKASAEGLTSADRARPIISKPSQAKPSQAKPTV